MIPEHVPGPSVNLEKVSLQADNVDLINDISCQFTAGEWHGVLGPNGGGKSTLLKTILGLTPHRGRVEIHWPATIRSALKKDGKKNTQGIEKQGNANQCIGYVPQLMPLDISLPVSVRDFLLMFLTDKPLWFKRRISGPVCEGLKHIELEDKLDRKIGDLSGGERQRLMLITALLKEPGLLILDEPMTGLDKTGRNLCLNLLVQFQRAGGTIIMVEHDWQLIKQHCKQIYWIDQHLKQQSASSFFANHPNHPNHPNISAA